VGDVRASCSRCNRLAERRGFNFVSIGTKEKKYRVSEFVEASQEVDYAYTKAENEGMTVKRPNLYKQALARARARSFPGRTKVRA